MNNITRKDTGRLRKAPLDFAILMEDREIEQVIVTFVSVLNERKRKRGDQN
ncbi:MAG: hypothetical protein AB2L22_13155 [Syntrophales bacterium]